MSNYKKNKELYLNNTGKTKLPKSSVERCQGLNIAGALDVFEEYAAIAVHQYHSGKDSNFSHCFNDKYQMPSRCPEPMKPIWNDENRRYLYRSIRNTVLKWTTETMVDHLINLFEILKDQEIIRLTAKEKERLLAIENQKKEQERIVKENQKKLMKMVMESIKKIKPVEPVEIEVQSENSSTRNVENSSNKTLPLDKISSLEFHKKTTKSYATEDKSETESDFLKNFNLNVSVKSSEISETVLNEEKILNEKMKNEENRIRNAMKDLLNEKLIKHKDLDEDHLENGEVKNGYKNIVETAEQAILLEEQKDKIMQKVKENLEDQINIAKDNSIRKKEIQRMDSIEEIMVMKKKIDDMKEVSNTNSQKKALEEDIDEINKKLDLAIEKYGSDKQIVDTKQVIITLGSLKRELDPYYLKSKVKNYGTLKIQNQQNDFIFL